MKLSWKPQLLSAIAAIATTICLTFAAATPVLGAAALVPGLGA